MGNETQPLISVVICFYNEESFMAEAIESVLQQSYGNWELILVDDGSTDKSTSIAKSYSKKFSQISYHRHPGHCNEGISASRNLGASRANGEYVAFLDASDTWLPEKLEQQLNVMRQHPDAKVIVSSSLDWRSWYMDTQDEPMIIGARPGLHHAPDLAMELYPLGEGISPRMSSLMVHRSVVEKHDFENSFKGIFQLYEDKAFLGKLFLNEKVLISHVCLTRSRYQPGSWTAEAQKTGKYDMVRKYYLQWFSTYLKWKNVPVKKIWSMLHKANMPYKQPWLYHCTTTLPRQTRIFLSRIFSPVRVG